MQLASSLISEENPQPKVVTKEESKVVPVKEAEALAVANGMIKQFSFAGCTSTPTSSCKNLPLWQGKPRLQSSANRKMSQ
jgi:hypothetical protein